MDLSPEGDAGTDGPRAEAGWVGAGAGANAPPARKQGPEERTSGFGLSDSGTRCPNSGLLMGWTRPRLPNPDESS